MLAVRIYETGGPEVLKLEQVDSPSPAPGEVGRPAFPGTWVVCPAARR